MRASPMQGLDRKKLRRWLLLFFLLLLIPMGVLTSQAVSELKWEAFHQQRQQGEALAKTIDARLAGLLSIESRRLFTDYAFLNIAGDPTANFLQRSPLSRFPVDTDIPGLIGHFQIDTAGNFSSPLLPVAGQSSQSLGINAEELQARTLLVNNIRAVLSENRLVTAAARKDADIKPDIEMADAKQELSEDIAYGQAAFDKLSRYSKPVQKKQRSNAGSLGRISELELDTRYQDEAVATSSVAVVARQKVRKEKSVLPAVLAAAPARILTFESEIDPFEVNLLASGHFVIYRKVWRDKQRYIQGLLISQQVLLDTLIRDVFLDSALSRVSKLIVAYQDEVLAAFSGLSEDRYRSGTASLSGSLLLQMPLSAPLNELELLFTSKKLPIGPGGAVVFWSSGLMLLVLLAGFYLMYRTGCRQISVLRQQQDFVSAVSHELKTPLTSIRMYGEMLREGWAPEEKKQSYYNYIYDESERLSRLINNVLQLARLTRNKIVVDLTSVSVGELMDEVLSKISTQIERAGFEWEVTCDEQLTDVKIRVDTDYFAQILINLVDNALKFSRDGDKKCVQIQCQQQQNGAVIFSVRDFGPGIARDQLKKIFQLFYRSGNELSRETVGTGIGLALVQQLAAAMHGQVDVINQSPGVEFRVVFTRLG